MWLSEYPPPAHSLFHRRYAAAPHAAHAGQRACYAQQLHHSCLAARADAAVYPPTQIIRRCAADRADGVAGIRFVGGVFLVNGTLAEVAARHGGRADIGGW